MNEGNKRPENVPVPQYNNVIEGYQAALKVVDDVILKNYVTRLSQMELVPLPDNVSEYNIRDHVLFFKINEMVYEKDEFATYKFASVFNALSGSDGAVYIILDSDGFKTDFYMGIRSMNEDKLTSSMRDTVRNAMRGQFPGIKTQDFTIEEIEEILGEIKGNSISAVTCVANSREDRAKNNCEFVQGLEKLVLSMAGEKYTGIIIASTTNPTQLRELRRGYESVYTQLSPFSSMQFNYGRNSTEAENQSNSDSSARNVTNSISTSETKGTSEVFGTSEENTASKIVKGVASAASLLGAGLSFATGGMSMALGGMVSGGLGLIGNAVAGTRHRSTSTSESETRSDSSSVSEGTSHTHTYGTSTAEGTSHALTLSAHDKAVESMMQRIDKQLKRLDEFESLGMYACAAYFLSENQYASEIAAATYKAIMQGENSGVEIAAINSWGADSKDKTEIVEQYVKNFMHPVFKYKGSLGEIEVTPCSMVSGNELAIHMGLPRKSVCGFPVVEHASFGKEVVKYGQSGFNSSIRLGKVFNMGNICGNDVKIDKASLPMHTFVTGSTGSGKSNTIYEIIRQIDNFGVHFMVIEPAKGEYKHVFGNRQDVNVYGTNPEYSDLLRINPFKFSHGIHVLEHVDRLVEIFNVCWPMYAAMPAVLKEALLKSYEDCGWDLSDSKNKYGSGLYPTFMDLQESLLEVINRSGYAEDVKSNYMGSLITRVKSLTNGLNGQIFSSREISEEDFFDKNVIIDLSRIGSLETKSLIMGILIMRLSEYRMSAVGAVNASLKHMTILEEAHNLLKRISFEQNPENPSLAGKSVEMISNAIAEMRTYGEGFIIVDQSPGAVDISAIRNTNTKIILRLPDETDRRLAGKAAGLKDVQLDEIAKLPKGVAVVYQNDWVEPVLCSIQKYKGEEGGYQYKSVPRVNRSTDRLKKNILEFLLKNRVKNPIDINIESLRKDIITAEISTKRKLMVEKILEEYESIGVISFWQKDNFDRLSNIVSEILNGNTWIKQILATTSEFDVLTDRIMHGISEQVEGLTAEYAIALAQCLMRAEAEKSDDCKEIYSAWITNLRNKGEF